MCEPGPRRPIPRLAGVTGVVGLVEVAARPGSASRGGAGLPQCAPCDRSAAGSRCGGAGARAAPAVRDGKTGDWPLTPPRSGARISGCFTPAPPGRAGRIGGIPKRPTGADCKSAGLRLRWFESTSLHQNCRIRMWQLLAMFGQASARWVRTAEWFDRSPEGASERTGGAARRARDQVPSHPPASTSSSGFRCCGVPARE